MKTTNPEFTKISFTEFLLSDDEMINVRGGGNENEPVMVPVQPPVKY
jgi:hypothetical protein